jgi:septal ring factor EnvC (AmiA/AmiB activator)
VVLAAIYRLSVNYFIPICKGAVDRHLTQIDSMLEQHKTDSDATTEALRTLHTDVTAVKTDVHTIRQHVVQAAP